MNVSKETKHQSFHFNESFSEKMDFVLSNSVCLNQLKTNLFEGIELPKESTRHTIDQLKKDLSSLEEELKEENNSESNERTEIEEDAFQTVSKNVVTKLDNLSVKLESFIDSFKPLLLSKKNRSNPNIQELHLTANMIRPLHKIVKSVFDDTENARKSKEAIRHLENEMRKCT